MSAQRMIDRRGALGVLGAVSLAPWALSGRPARAAAPMMGVARPSFYRAQLGGFEVTTLFDGGIALEGPHPIFGHDQSAEAVQALAEQNFLSPTQMEITFTPVVVNTGRELVLFDSGNAPGRPGTGNLGAALAAAGFEPGQIDVVVITHMHPDHIGGLMTDGKPTWPNARYVTGETEYDFWSKEERLSGPTEGAAKLVQANVVPLAENTTFVNDEGEVVSGIHGLAAHGHTPGHMAWHIESEGRRLLLWGDTANHYVMSVQRPDWHVRFDTDKAMAAATRKRILDLAATDRIPVTGYHMPFPAVGYIDKQGSDWRWVPAGFQTSL